MKSREEFEALVKKKIESKQGIAVQNRRAWESVAATAVACFLIFWISYLAVPHLMGNRPVGTGAQTDGDSTEGDFLPTDTTADTTVDSETQKNEDRVTTTDDILTPSTEITTEDIGETIPPATSEKDEITSDTSPDTTEPPETSESETDPPADTTKPPETSESETDPPADTTRLPETSDSETEPIITEPPVDTSGEDDPKDTSEAETEPDVVLELTWDQAILEKADFSDALYQNLNASSLLLSYTYHPILYREDGLDRNGYLRILQFDRVANQFKQMTYLDLVSDDGERVTHMLVFGKAQILVSEDEPMHLWIVNISVMQSGQGNMTFCRYWISDVSIDSLSGNEIPHQDVSMIVDYSNTRYTQSRVGFNVRRESDVDIYRTTYSSALSESMNNFRMMQQRGATYYRIADSLLANAEVWRIADQMPCPDIEIYEDEMTLERIREHYIENIQPYTW